MASKFNTAWHNAEIERETDTMHDKHPLGADGSKDREPTLELWNKKIQHN